MSIGWEEDSGFLQSGMEPRGGTMGPGTAPHSHQSPPRWRISAFGRLPRTLCLVFRADGGASRWIPAASPQQTFSGILAFDSGRPQSLGEGWAANGLFLERLAGGTRFPARGAARGL